MNVIDVPKSLAKCSEAMTDMADLVNEFSAKMKIIRDQMKLSVEDESDPDVKQCILSLADAVRIHVEEAEDELIGIYIFVVEDCFRDEPFVFPGRQEVKKEI